MKDIVLDAYDTLKEYDFIMPYETAFGFIYTHLPCFHPRFLPKAPKYFFPFQPYQCKTFYYINNIIPLLHDLNVLSNYVKTPAGSFEITKRIELAILYIFIIGISDDERDKLIWSQYNLEKMQPLLKDFYSTSHYLSEILENKSEEGFTKEDLPPLITIGTNSGDTAHIHKLIMDIDFLKKYDIELTEENDNLIVYTNNLIA